MSVEAKPKIEYDMSKIEAFVGPWAPPEKVKWAIEVLGPDAGSVVYPVEPQITQVEP